MIAVKKRTVRLFFRRSARKGFISVRSTPAYVLAQKQTLISINAAAFAWVILNKTTMERAMTNMLRRIALTLARSKDFPNGSSQIGYDLIAPLDGNGHIDLPAWKKHRADCVVRHFSPGEGNKTGLLVHKAGGAEHGRWVFDYDVARDDDDEAGFMFGHHAFLPGEYVSICDTRGAMHTFVVKSVTSVTH